MRDLGELILQKCQYLKKALRTVPGVKADVLGGSSFQEIVVNFDDFGSNVKEISEKLLKYNIFCGKDLTEDFPFLGNSALFAVTEKTCVADVDRLVSALCAIRKEGK